MTIQDELLLPLMRHLGSGDNAALADNIALSWLKILRKFAPLIGSSSVLLMFERSLESNQATFGWLPPLSLSVQPDAAIERLRASMAERPVADVLAAHRAILTTFIDLMTTLIGARLTVQFLRAAGPADPVDPADAAGRTPKENLHDR